MPDTFYQIPAWSRWQLHLGETLHISQQQIDKLALTTWHGISLGLIESKCYHEFLCLLVKRVMAEKGYSGACMTDQEKAKEEAIQQFFRRCKAANLHGTVDNTTVPAGEPMFFYCKWCGIFIESLPEDYLFPPRQECSQCKGLGEMSWLSLAIEANR